jgi:hypothetical protein
MKIKTMMKPIISRWLTVRCFTLLAFFSMLSPGGLSAAPKDCPPAPAVFTYHPEVSRLEGILSQRQVYGPPGYGEDRANHRKAKIAVLKLFRPIEVKPAAGAAASNTANLDPLKNVSEIQLFYAEKGQQTFSRQHFGKRVSVVGTLEQGVVGGEYTALVMQVKQMVATQSSNVATKRIVDQIGLVESVPQKPGYPSGDPHEMAILALGKSAGPYLVEKITFRKPGKVLDLFQYSIGDVALALLQEIYRPAHWPDPDGSIELPKKYGDYRDYVDFMRSSWNRRRLQLAWKHYIAAN